MSDLMGRLSFYGNYTASRRFFDPARKRDQGKQATISQKPVKNLMAIGIFIECTTH